MHCTCGGGSGEFAFNQRDCCHSVAGAVSQSFVFHVQTRYYVCHGPSTALVAQYIQEALETRSVYVCLVLFPLEPFLVAQVALLIMGPILMADFPVFDLIF